jgi:PTH1 family peptidyl-tRNA hydrolase
MIKLIVGLGNPGIEYSKTRHNIGFISINKLVEFFNIKKFSNRYNSIYFEINNLKGNKVFFLMPQTYMNNSGIAVQAFCRFFKIQTNDVVVIHDDIDLELGKIKVKIGGGHGGHNGLKSIDQHIGQNYLRIRLGVGKPHSGIDVADYVLNNFSKTEETIANRMVDFVADNISELLNKNVSADDISRFIAMYSNKP